MGLNIFDSVCVIDLTVFIRCFGYGHTVFGNDHRQLISLIDLFHTGAESIRINSHIHPFCLFKIRVCTDVIEIGYPERRLVVIDRACLFLGADTEVIIDTDEVACGALEDCLILFFRYRIKIMVFQIGSHKRGICASDTHIEHIEFHQFLCLPCG